MSKPLNLDIVGKDLAPASFDYDWKTCALYALGIGAGAGELPFVFEQAEPFRVFPSFAVVPTFPVIVDALGQVNADWRTLVHGEQTITMHAAIPKQGRFVTVGRVSKILDKGKGAIVLIDTETRADDALLFETQYSIFCRGQGDFGGDRGARPELLEPAPGAAPAFEWSGQTTANQAMLYRLSGDLNPLHIDPKLATKVGFEGPILHGLCTYGFATRAIVAELCGGDPTRLARFSARFSQTVYPGDALTIRALPSTTAGTYLLEASVGDRVVLSHGVVELR